METKALRKQLKDFVVVTMTVGRLHLGGLKPFFRRTESHYFLMKNRKKTTCHFVPIAVLGEKLKA